jgi:NAD(P)-dependent dehydrogenase (short-subunit alcohol dehydrogenase family)/SAM-dependent methyltransferase/acyl carrier protein
VIGHSLGEIAAAHSAGAISLDDAVRIAIERGKSMLRAQGSGGMLATTLSAEDLGNWIAKLGGGLEVAVDNGETASVASGPLTALDALQHALEAEGEIVSHLTGNIPFHHSALSVCQPGLRHALKWLKPEPLRLPFASTVTGEISKDLKLDADYWVENIRAPVRFRDALGWLTALGPQYFIEIAPHPALQQHIRRSVGSDNANRVSECMTRDASDTSLILAAQARLFVDGLAAPADPGNSETGQQINLPPYPWVRKRHWIEVDDSPASPVPDELKTWQQLVNTGTSQSGFVPVGLDVGQYDNNWRTLNQIAFADIEQTLRQLTGSRTVLDSAKCIDAVTPAYKDLVKRWFVSLEHAGRIEQQGDAWRGIVDFDPEQRVRCIEELKTASADIAVLVDYIVRCGDNLTDIVTGRSEALETLFPDGSWETVESLYHDWSVARYFNSIVSAIVNRRASGVGKEKPLRILEVGGGTGGTTRSIAPSLSGLNVAYNFTDISPYFFEPVRKKLGEYQFISYGVLDLDVDPRQQGYADGSFDVIVAANSLHAVRDLSRSASYLRRLLADDGQLLLYEITEQFPWLDSSVALIEGWGKFEDTLRSDSPLLSPEQWRKQLADCGFRDTSAFPAEDLPTSVLGQRVILAHADGKAPTADTEPDRTWLYQSDWKPQPLKQSVVPPVSILVVADENDIATALAGKIEATGGVAFSYSPGADTSNWLEILKSDRPNFVIHVADTDTDTDTDTVLATPTSPAISSICSAQKILSSVLELPDEQQPKLLFATTGAVAGFDDIVDTGHAALWGWVRGATNEHPSIVRGIVDFDPASDAEARADQLLAELTGDGDQSAWRSGLRYVSRIVRTDEFPPEQPIDVGPEGLYLITGGLGVLGLRVASYLAEREAAGVILLSRNAQTAELSETAAATVRKIEDQGTKVHLAAADVADQAKVQQVIENIESATGQSVRGVVHAAGALDSVPLAQLNEEAIRHALHAKAVGAWTLHNLFCDRELEFFTLFGSASSVLAPPGHGAYAAANAYLDALAALRRQTGLPGTSISWGIWEGAGAVAEATIARFKEMSFSEIPFERGLELFGKLAGHAGQDQIVLPGEPEQWARTADLWLKHPVTEGLWHGSQATAERDADSTPLADGKEAALCLEIGAVMNLDPGQLDIHRRLLDQGFDSLMAVSLKGRIESRFGVVVPITALVGTTNIVDLLELVEQDGGEKQKSTENPDDRREVLSI